MTGHWLDQFTSDEPAPEPAPPAASVGASSTATSAAVTGGAPLGKVRALFEYVAQQSDDLGFAVGEVITVEERIGSDWLRGSLNGRSGMFPATFVEEFDYTGRAVACFDYQASAGDELSLAPGVEIVLLDTVGADWFLGRIGPREGIFPASFVEVTKPLE